VLQRLPHLHDDESDRTRHGNGCQDGVRRSAVRAADHRPHAFRQSLLVDDAASPLEQPHVAPDTCELAKALAATHDLEHDSFVEADAGSFSGQMPVWIVQMPAASVELISHSRSGRPTPWPRGFSSTQTLFSTTPP
jgi:hypothetical protein